MNSPFAEQIGLALKALAEYDRAVSEFISGTGPEPAIPQSVLDAISQTGVMISDFAGYQSTISEGRMNRELEGLRSVSRASFVSDLSREDLYIAASFFASDSALRTEGKIDEVQAIIDVRHPNQTGIPTT